MLESQVGGIIDPLTEADESVIFSAWSVDSMGVVVQESPLSQDKKTINNSTRVCFFILTIYKIFKM